MDFNHRKNNSCACVRLDRVYARKKFNRKGYKLMGDLNTFEDVKKRYDETRVLVSGVHSREEDVRPIGKRGRKWERVEKVSPDKYVLHDVLPRNPNSWGSDWHRRALRRPPIVWERYPTLATSTEFVTVRGAVSEGYDTSRYNFLRFWLPLGLEFDNWTQIGKHFVNVYDPSLGASRMRVNRYYLPRPEFTKPTQNYAGSHKDYFLVFKRENKGLWQLCSEEHNTPRVRVDKEAKKALKEDIVSFFTWLCATGPLLKVKIGKFGFVDMSYMQTEVNEYVSEHKEFLEDDVDYNSVYSRGSLHMGPKLALSVLTDYNHPLRIHLASMFLMLNDIKQLNTEEDVRSFKAAFNKWTNKIFDFNYITKDK